MSTATGIDPLAVSTEVRLARMGRENAATKAMRYLVEARVQLRVVTNRQVRAQVRGSGHLWDVAFDAYGWRCDCPARGDCCHLLAVRSVVVVDGDRVSSHG